MLKIAIVTNNYKPYSGGVVSSIESFAFQLRQKGHKVYIITLDFVSQNKLIEQDVFRIYCPLKFKYKNNPLAVPFMPTQVMLSILKNLGPDIIHTQHPFLLGISALKCAKKLDLPIIFTYHTRYEQYLHYIPFPQIFTCPIVQSLASSYCNKVDGIIAPSLSIHEILMQNKINKAIEIIASGVLPIFSTNQNFIERTFNNPFHLLTVSRFAKEKNIKFLLDMFAKLDQDKFIFTLIGYGAELSNLQDHAYHKLRLSKKNIVFMEKPTKEIIAAYYRSADLFIFGSVSETQGLVLAEAMSAGMPVVAHRASGSNDIVEDGLNGFLIESIEQMVEKINLISGDKDLYKNLQQNAFNTGKLYSSENMTNKLINFYNLILK